MTILSRLATLRHDQSGSVIIESVLSFMVTMLMVLGIIECCVMAYTFGVIEEAAREGVRYASMHGTDSSTCSGPSTGCADSSATNVSSDVTTYAKSFISSTSSMKVTVTYPDGTSTANSRVKVAVQYSYQPLFHTPLAKQVLAVSSQGRIVY